MEKYICSTCGTQYPPSDHQPESCQICEEERQYVALEGQEWTTLDEMLKSSAYNNKISQEESNLYSIKTVPEFAIGQTAYLVQNNGFNLLWDCISYLDHATIQSIKELGGIHAIALSHPHYYSSQIEWAETFNVPIYIHEDDRQWVMRNSDHIIFWSGESLKLHEGIDIHRLGGHFKGGAVLHWQMGHDGKGVLLTGDIIQVVADRQWVSFMYSYPNLIPLPPETVERMAGKVKPLAYDRLYNAFHKIIEKEANLAVQRSAERYIKAVRGQLFQT
ncbi:MBL fold metallo-hydrolase [Bacillus sp. ISL-47]|uniref:MBL fold metallo-hydrolase n=1 Tax=Bacillus sp. ISL-47 TaxID=2819130 RepID=UPI001BE95A8E|nr:MBL fold metallo-hydrolase [Bacillus sp. ISL-47]MBT2690212.1 MBL fold metallo-hydrolase [Bacillus sp. ISL-47]MBT2710339.1 MBL fold metallo-hydrolase [Pseudomonas sp. ISL-84]